MAVLVTDVAAAEALRGAGFAVVVVSADQILARAIAERPEAVLVDVGASLDLVRRLQAAGGRDGGLLPVMALGGPGKAAEALRAGAEDYLARPWDPAELCARVEALVRVRRAFDEAARARSEVEEYALIDRLTGLPNGRYLTARVDEEFRRATRFSEPLALLAIDLDELEQVNGRWGRGVGDRLLEACAKSIAQACRDTDLVARAGGDEFVVVLSDASLAHTLATAEKVWTRLRGTSVDEGGTKVSCDASIGAACYPGRDVTSARELLRAAHSALTRAKSEGRGRICLYQHQGYLFQPA